METIAARGRETGQTLVLFVLALGVFMGFVALSVDVGLILHERRNMQNAADAAALAAAQELPTSPGTAVAMAEGWADRHGYTLANGAAITVNTPYNGDPATVEVIIQETTPFLFARALGMNSVGVQARAVATKTTGAAGLGIGLLVLNPGDGNSFVKSGDSDISINNDGAIMVNDASPDAIKLSGGGNVYASGGFYYYEEGAWDSSLGTGEFLPTPAPVGYQIPDPLANLVPPDPYAITSPLSGGTAANPATLKLNSGDFTLLPGTYWGGLEIASTANVTFEPGVYILAGGGLKLVGSGTVTGDGVLIYNTFDPENPIGDGACAEIHLRGTADFSITGPTAGPYADILFWQDEACTNPMRHEGSGDFTAGIIYLPSAELVLAGSGVVGALQVIVDTITISGTADLIIDSQNFLDVQLPPIYRLAE